MRPSRKLAQWSIFTFTFSLFFWSWALANTVQKKELDLGIFSFITVMISSGYIYHVCSYGAAATKLEVPWLRITIMITYGLVVLNYAIGVGFGIYMGVKGFAIYCAIFIFIWSSIAYRTWYLITKTIHRYEPLLEANNSGGVSNANGGSSDNAHFPSGLI